jgi:hypothetical protein
LELTGASLSKARYSNYVLFRAVHLVPFPRHFNMNPRRRIDNFQGTDVEYIEYLESKVAQLSVLRPPPDSPLSLTLLRDGANEESDNDVAIKFIEFDPYILP